MSDDVNISEEATDVLEDIELVDNKELSDEEQDLETSNNANQELREDLSEDELDAIADTVITELKEILRFFDVGEVTIDEYVGDDGELILDITGGDLAVLIGRHGSTLNALQFLVSSITVRKIGFRYPVVVDIEGYKSRQRQRIEAIAQSSANRAMQQKRNVKMRPMTPYERRIVHITLRDDSRVETVSEGEGGSRHVVVVPVS